MLSKIKLEKNFDCFEPLAKSAFKEMLEAGVTLSTEKPNVLVGPNGSGKSSFIKLLAMVGFAYSTGKTCYDKHQHDMFKKMKVLTESDTRASWRNKYSLFPGLVLTGQTSGMTYFDSPEFTPGWEADHAHAICMGYSKSAKDYYNLTDKKSSGQKRSTLIEQLLENVLLSGNFDKEVKTESGSSIEKLDLKDPGYSAYSWDWFNYEMLRRMPTCFEEALVLMDEPDQSLDCKTSIVFWKQLSQQHKSVQSIIVSHSVYPLLEKNAENFNLIETIPGYIESVKQLLK